VFYCVLSEWFVYFLAVHLPPGVFGWWYEFGISCVGVGVLRGFGLVCVLCWFVGVPVVLVVQGVWGFVLLFAVGVMCGGLVCVLQVVEVWGFLCVGVCGLAC